MLSSVVVAIDGSPHAEAALPHAAGIARAIEVPIRVVHVLSPSGAAGHPPVDAVEWSLHRTRAATHLAGVRERLASSGIVVDVEVSEGTSTGLISEVCLQVRDPLLVIASHGRESAPDFELSGATHSALRAAASSVMVVPTRDHDAVALEPRRYARILVPLDGSKRSHWTLRTATTIARTHGAAVVLAHVVATPLLSYGDLPLEEVSRRLSREVVERNLETAARYFHGIRTELDADGITSRCHIVESRQVGPRLAELANDEDVDLIVMSAHGAGMNGALQACWHMGSVAQAMISHPGRPTLVLQDAPSGGPSSAGQATMPPRAPARPPSA